MCGVIVVGCCHHFVILAHVNPWGHITQCVFWELIRQTRTPFFIGDSFRYLPSLQHIKIIKNSDEQIFLKTRFSGWGRFSRVLRKSCHRVLWQKFKIDKNSRLRPKAQRLYLQYTHTICKSQIGICMQCVCTRAKVLTYHRPINEKSHRPGQRAKTPGHFEPGLAHSLLFLSSMWVLWWSN